MLIERIDQALVEAAKLRDSAKEPALWLSNSGICARRLAYQIHKVPHDDPPNPRRSRTFEFGHATERCVREWLRMAGVALEGEQRKVTLDCGDGVTASGMLDAEFTLDGERWILECKSINTDGFQRTMRSEPDSSHIAQVQAYMEATGIHHAVLLYVDKNDQELLEVFVCHSPVIVEQIKRRFRSVAASTPELLPDREHDAVNEVEFKRGKAPVGTPLIQTRKTGWYKPTGRKVLGWQCAYCPWKKPCWGVGDPEFKDGRPVFVIQETAVGEFMR